MNTPTPEKMIAGPVYERDGARSFFPLHKLPDDVWKRMRADRKKAQEQMKKDEAARNQKETK